MTNDISHIGLTPRRRYPTTVAAETWWHALRPALALDRLLTRCRS
jgi:hypothetical protein